MKVITTGLLLMISLLFLGCSPAEQLKSQLEKNVCSLAYIQDSEPIAKKMPATVFVEELAIEQDLPSEVVVTLDKSNLTYLVLAAWRSEEFTCELGKTVLEEDPATFIADCIKQELQRSGLFTLADTQETADYILSTNLANCGTKLVYRQSVTAAGYSTFYEKSASPSVSAITIAIALTEGGNVLIQDNITAVKTTPYPLSGPQSSIEVSRNCVENMAESFSLAIKDCVEQIVKKINEQSENWNYEGKETAA